MPCRAAKQVLAARRLIATAHLFWAAARLIKQWAQDIYEAAPLSDLPDLGGSTQMRRHIRPYAVPSA